MESVCSLWGAKWIIMKDYSLHDCQFLILKALRSNYIVFWRNFHHKCFWQETAYGRGSIDANFCCILNRSWGSLLYNCLYGSCRLRLKVDGTRAQSMFRLSAKRTSPFKSAGMSVQSTTGSRGVRISGSNARYTMFRGSVRVLGTHPIRHFPLHFTSRVSPCAVTFQLDSTRC